MGDLPSLLSSVLALTHNDRTQLSLVLYASNFAFVQVAWALCISLAFTWHYFNHTLNSQIPEAAISPEQVHHLHFCRDRWRQLRSGNPPKHQAKTGTVTLHYEHIFGSEHHNYKSSFIYRAILHPGSLDELKSWLLMHFALQRVRLCPTLLYQKDLFTGSSQGSPQSACSKCSRGQVAVTCAVQ